MYTVYFIEICCNAFLHISYAVVTEQKKLLLYECIHNYFSRCVLGYDQYLNTEHIQIIEAAAALPVCCCFKERYVEHPGHLKKCS